MAASRNSRLHLLGISLLAVMAGSMLLQYLIARSTLADKDNELMRNFIAREISNIDGWLREHEQIVSLGGTLVKNGPITETAALPLLRQLLAAGRDFSTIYLGTPDNLMINASGWKMPANFDLRTRPWYIAAARAGQITTTPVFLNASRDLLIITICKPLLDERNNLLGVLAGDLPITSLLARVALKAPENAGFSMLLDTGGRLLAHSAISRAKNPLELAPPHGDYTEIIKEISRQRSGSMNCTIAGTDGLLVFQHLPRLDLIIAGFVPDTHLTDTVRGLSLVFIIVFILSLGIWSGFIWYQRRHIEVPLALLDKGISAIDPDARPWYRIPAIGSPDFKPLVERINEILLRIENYFQDKNIAEKALRQSLAEKDALLREVHHRVKNNMQIVVSLLETQSDYQHDPKVVESLRQISQRVQSMAFVHEELYRSSGLDGIRFRNYAERIIGVLFQACEHGPELEWAVEDDNSRLDLVRAIPCGLIINELVANSLKHAFPENRPGRISVSLFSNPDRETARHYVLSVQDNGIGLPAGFEIGMTQSFGLQLVSILVRQLGAELSLDRNQGTRFTIVF